MKKFLTTALIAGTLLATSAHAGMVDLGYMKITRMHTYAPVSDPLFSFPHMMANGCNRSDWFILPKEGDHYAENLKVLMLSKLAETPVRILIDGCKGGFPVIKHLEW